MTNNKTDEIIFESRNDYSHDADVNKLYDTIVIGIGVSGYSCAMYLARLGLKVLMIGENPGGMLALTGKVENYPGFVSINGLKLTQLLENHMMDYNIDVEYDIVDLIEENKDKNKKEFLAHLGKKFFKSKSIILATGSRLKKLNVKGEDEFFGNGVSYCALCDAAFIKNKTIGVIGGGDSAIKEAILVLEYAKKVFIINNEKEIHPESHNEKILNQKIKENKIEIINSNEVIEIKGKDSVEKIVLKKNYNESKELNLDGIFVYIGNTPNSELSKKLGIKLNDKQEVIIDQYSKTNIKGIYACGDVTNFKIKLAITGVSQGVCAACSAYEYLKNL